MRWITIFRRALHQTNNKLQASRSYCSCVSSFPELHVKVQTCGDLYEQWRKEKRYRKIPEGNLNFNISYVDTSFVGNSQKRGNLNFNTTYGDTFIVGNSRKPLAVALHGAPGTYRDFDTLTSHLHENGIRVVVPNFPDFTTCKPGIFRHSCEEKKQLLKDFFKQVNITEIDMLIIHSSSVYPGLQLCAENDLPKIRSLGMFNTGSYERMRFTRPYKAFSAFVRLGESPLGLKFLEFCGTTVMKLTDVPVRLDNVMDPLLSATTVYYSNLQQAKRNFEIISSRKLPVLYAFAEDDKLVEKRFSYDVAYLLGASDSTIFYYDECGKLLNSGVEQPFLKVMIFKNGSHYVFKKYPDIINEAVLSFMMKVLKGQQ